MISKSPNDSNFRTTNGVLALIQYYRWHNTEVSLCNKRCVNHTFVAKDVWFTHLLLQKTKKSSFLCKKAFFVAKRQKAALHSLHIHSANGTSSTPYLCCLYWAWSCTAQLQMQDWGFTHFPTFAIGLVVLLPLPCSAAHSRSRQLSTFARFIFCLVSELNQLTKLWGASTNMGGEEGKGQSAQELP